MKHLQKSLDEFMMAKYRLICRAAQARREPRPDRGEMQN